MKQTYSFDDVLLVPQYSDIKSRSEVSTNCALSQFEFTLPIISSPMDTITETNMVVTLSEAGALGIIHRYNSIREQAQLVVDARIQSTKNIGAAIGISSDFLERAVAVVDVGANILCVDVAHGHHSMMKKAIADLKDKFGDQVHIMAGNVATLEAFDALASWGADSVRVGIGGGSICSTRIVTGHGVPTLQSVMECAKSSYDTKIIADGGIKTSGDIVKALAAGADFVMIGSMLAGTEESPGDVRATLNGEKFKEYRGMASKEAQRDWRGKSSTPEGVATMVPYRGSVNAILADIEGGIRSGLSYTGARSISELQAKAQFILQSSAAQMESNTHILWRNK